MKQDARDRTGIGSIAKDADSSASILSSRELFLHAKTVCIEHNGEHYWLRLTRGNKLILTK